MGSIKTLLKNKKSFFLSVSLGIWVIKTKKNVLKDDEVFLARGAASIFLYIRTYVIDVIPALN